MPAVDASIILLPRPTTLIGATTFTTAPLDVSQFGSIEFQLWRGPIAGGGSPTILFYFEESLDSATWALGPSTPVGYDPADASTGGDPTFALPQFFSYAFRLRWFRIRVVTTGSAPILNCWVEGFLRDGGDGGSWTHGPVPQAANAGSMMLAPPIGGDGALGTGVIGGPASSSSLSLSVHGKSWTQSATPSNAEAPGRSKGVASYELPGMDTVSGVHSIK